jgi:hypothetical protein
LKTGPEEEESAAVTRVSAEGSDGGWSERARDSEPVAESSSPLGAGEAEPDEGIEAALAQALLQAAAAGRFDVVAQLARELEARRLARAGNVVRLEAPRRG